MGTQHLTVGSLLDREDLVVDFGINKTELSKVTQTCRGTVIRLDEIAAEYLEDYKAEYPPITVAQARRRVSKNYKPRSYNSEVPLTPYQAWVLSRLKSLFFALKSVIRVEQFLKDNTELFSRAKFIYKQSVVRQATASKVA